MVVAAFQFSNRMRARYLQVHRILGYVYVTSVFISCPFAVLISAKLARSPSQFVANCMNSFWVGHNDSNRALLYSQRPPRPTPPLDDTQLPMGNDIYLQSSDTRAFAKHACGPSRL